MASNLYLTCATYRRNTFFICISFESFLYTFIRPQVAIIYTNSPCFGTMICYTHLFFVFVLCFHFLNGEIAVHNTKTALNKSVREVKTDAHCQTLDGPDWTINKLKNVPLDIWPWNCLLSRYTNNSLDDLVEKSVHDIYTAAKRGDLGFVQYYAERNNFIRDANVKELLYKTAEGGDLGTLKYLVEVKGLQVDVKDQTLLLASATGGNVNLIKYLIHVKHLTRNGTDNFHKNTPLHYAALAGKLNAVRFLIENLNHEVDARNIYDETPSLHAVVGGHLTVLKYLIEEEQANSSVRSDSGTTLLHSAAYHGYLAIVKYLVEQKHLGVELRDNYENTPLSDAAQGGHLNVVKYLVNVGKANTHTKNAFNRNLLHQAVAGNNLDVMKYFVEELNMSSQIEDADLANSTVAMYAAQEGAVPILKYLINEKGANIMTVDSLQHNLLQAAARENRLGVVEYLVEEHNFDINEKSPGDGRTADSIAIFYNAPKADIRKLLDYFQKRVKESTRSYLDML